jgi:branched-chain amino acid transport system substrate-binding protein
MVRASEGSGDSIRIGLLIPDGRSLAARKGAELAVRNANDRGGIKGKPVRLIVKSMEGPWGTGSTQAVNLVFNDEVVALLGLHDGRNAHLVEQVAAKSRVVFLSAWSGDPTLAQAFVPWFFNAAFDDNRQAESLYREIYETRKFNRIAVVSNNAYDSGSALKNFLKRTGNSSSVKPLLLEFNENKDQAQDIIPGLKAAGPDCIVLFVQPPASLRIIEQLRLNNLNVPVYCTPEQLDENLLSTDELSRYGDTRFVTSVDLSSQNGSAFVEEYKAVYETLPGAVAAYAFDGMRILLDAIARGGTEREGLQKALLETDFEGVTGLIQFDERGSRKGSPGLAIIKRGIPVLLK